MYEFQKKNAKVFTGKSVGTGPLSYEKRIYRAAVSQRLRNSGVGHIMIRISMYCQMFWVININILKREINANESRQLNTHRTGISTSPLQ